MASWRSGKSSKKSSSLFFSFYPVLAIIIGLVLWWTLSDVKFPKFSKRASHTKIENKKEKTSNLQPEQSPDDYSKIDDTICLLGKVRLVYINFLVFHSFFKFAFNIKTLSWSLFYLESEVNFGYNQAIYKKFQLKGLY